MRSPTSAPAQAPERSGETRGKCPEKARSRSGHALVASWSCTGSCGLRSRTFRDAARVGVRSASPCSRACSVRGPSEDRREHRKDSSLVMRSSSQNRQARTADGRCQEPGGARVRALGARNHGPSHLSDSLLTTFTNCESDDAVSRIIGNVPAPVSWGVGAPAAP